MNIKNISYGGAMCGDSICRICKRRISMEEGVLDHHLIYHPRTKEAKWCRQLNKKWGFNNE